jgi:hypothetical protein
MHGPGGQFRSSLVSCGSLIALAAILAAGCTTLRPAETQLRPVGNRAPSYDSATISYRLPSAAPQSAGEVQTVSYSSPPATPARTQILSIEYPHPAGKRGFALAEVIVARDPATVADNRSNDWLAGFRRMARDRMPGITYGEGIESAWALDVPIAEVDELIARLDAQGYFADKNRPTAGAELSARINGLSFSKPWQSVPELNALVGQVRREGKLVSHRQPLELSPPRTESPVTVASATTASATPAPVTTALYSAPAENQSPPLCERLPPVQ